MKLLAICLGWVAVVAAGCSKEKVQAGDYIKYGTSFGMCAGYCYNQLTVKQTGVEVLRRQNGSNKTKECRREFDEARWKSILEKLDLEKFSALDTVIGCPDCADGGAEWVEIKHGSKKHKVTFDYRREPEVLKPILTDLRQQMESFADCK